MSNKGFVFLILGCALFVGILYVAPHLFIWRYLSEQNQGYLLSQFGDEIIAYIPSGHEVYDGHFPPADYFFDDLKLSLFPPIPPLIFASFILIFRGDVQLAYLAALFLFSGIIFTLFYIVGWKIFREKAWAIFFGFFSTLTASGMPYAFFSIDKFLNVIGKNFYPLVRTPMERLALMRFDEPLLTLPFLLVTILCLFLFWQKPQKSTALWSGAMVGILFYIYFHYWVYIVIVAGLLLLLAGLQYKKDIERFKFAILLNATFLIISIPYFLNYFSFRKTDGYNDFIHRVGIRIYEGRVFDIIDYPYYIAFVIIGFIVYKLWFHKDRRRAELYFVFLLASILALNIQVVTGFVPEPGHWVKVIHVIVSLIVFNCLVEISRRRLSPKIVFAIVVILSSLLVIKKINNAIIFIQPPAEVLPYYVFNQDIIDSWLWIDNYLPRESKIISPSFLTTDFLTSYTSARPYLPVGVKTTTTNKILEERFLTTYKLFDIDSATLQSRLKIPPLGTNWKTPDILRKLNMSIPMYLYYNYFTRDFGGNIPEQKIRELVDRYSAINPSWESIDADYVYSGPFEQELTFLDPCQAI